MKEFYQEMLELFYPWLVVHGFRIILILVGAYIIYKISGKFIDKMVRATVTLDRHLSEESERKREDTLIKIFSWASNILLLLIAAMMVMQEIGIPVGPIIAGAGIVGLAFGFGGQYLIRDFITGIFMILENQYRIGDVVSLDDTEGLVEDISLRMTTLRDLNGIVHHVPHGDIRRVSNHSKNFARVNLDVHVAYHSDLERVIQVLNQVGVELAEDPAWKDIIIKAPQFLRVNELADSSIAMKMLGETLPHRHLEVTGELRKRIKQVFDREGIEIPFPQRVLHQYMPPAKE
jgi:small conductance mechanosensitive channel